MGKTMETIMNTIKRYQHWKPKSTPSSSSYRYQQQKTMVSSHSALQILLIITLFSSSHALLGSDDEQAVEFNNELLLRSEPVSKMKSRLETLLDLKRSIRALMQQRDDLSAGTDSIEDSTADNSVKEIVTDKRVFCNGFTGCGGRFRGRWVQQLALEDMRKRMEKAVASKRPFCNTNGCFNGGKRKPERSGKTVLNGKAYLINDNRLSDSSSASATNEKRLFCNGYGGCQNMGKRGLLIPLLMGERRSLDDNYVMEKPTKPVFEITLEPTKEKRFFASNFDSKMEGLMSRIE